MKRFLNRIICRFDSNRVVFDNTISTLPLKPVVEADPKSLLGENEIDKQDFKLEKHEIEARIYNVVREFKKIQFKDFNMSHSFDKLGLDSLETIALITSIEKEFNIVFEETIFDNFESLEDVSLYIGKSKYAF